MHVAQLSVEKSGSRVQPCFWRALPPTRSPRLERAHLSFGRGRRVCHPSPPCARSETLGEGRGGIRERRGGGYGEN